METMELVFVAIWGWLLIGWPLLNTHRPKSHRPKTPSTKTQSTEIRRESRSEYDANRYLSNTDEA